MRYPSNVIDRSSALPIYSQIASKIQQQIVDGDLMPGNRIPSVRELMHAYATSSHTVQRALRTLETAGLVAGKPGSGVYVAHSRRAENRRTNELRISNPTAVSAQTINEFQRMVPGGKFVFTHESPDVVYAGGNEVLDRLADITDLVEEIFGYLPEKNPFFTSLQHKGRNVLVPVEVKTGVVWCNTGLFEVQGIQLPDRGWQWADCAALARELNRPSEGRYGIYLSGMGHICPSVIWQKGAKLFSPDGRRCHIDSDAGIAAGELVRTLSRFTPPIGPDHQWRIVEGLDHFVNGRVAMIIAPAEISAEVFQKMQSVRWKAVPLPADGVPIYVKSVYGFGLCKESPVPNLAREFLRIVGKELKLPYALGTWHGLPLYAEYAQHDEAEAAYLWTVLHARDLLSDVLPDCRSRQQEQAFRLVTHEFERLAISQRPVKDIMQDLANRLNVLLTDEFHAF